jgi:hypothetical protein
MTAGELVDAISRSAADLKVHGRCPVRVRMHPLDSELLLAEHLSVHAAHGRRRPPPAGPMSTLEQELAAVAAGTDYRLVVHDSGTYLHVQIIYVPAFHAADVGGRVPVVMNAGIIGYKLFGSWRRWPRTLKWVRSTIEGHRALLVASGVRQVR